MTREEEIQQAATQIAKEWYVGPEEEFYSEIEKLIEMAQWCDEHPKSPWIAAMTTAEPTDFDGMTIRESERERIYQALMVTGGNRKQAAKLLGISERTIYRKMKEYNL